MCALGLPQGLPSSTIVSANGWLILQAAGPMEFCTTTSLCASCAWARILFRFRRFDNIPVSGEEKNDKKVRENHRKAQKESSVCCCCCCCCFWHIFGSCCTWRQGSVCIRRERIMQWRSQPDVGMVERNRPGGPNGPNWWWNWEIKGLGRFHYLAAVMQQRWHKQLVRR